MDDGDLGERVIQRGDQTFNFFAVLTALPLDFGRELGAVRLGDAVNFHDVADLQVRELRDAVFEPGVRVGGKGDVGGFGGDGEIRRADGLHAAVNVVQFAVVMVFIAFIARWRSRGRSHVEFRSDGGGGDGSSIQYNRVRQIKIEIQEQRRSGNRDVGKANAHRAAG